MGKTASSKKTAPSAGAGPATAGGRRVYTLGRFFLDRFGFQLHKISLDAGFTCPNRDGKLGSGGCAYCDNRSFAPGTSRAGLAVREQVEREIALAHQRYGASGFIAYFQAYTNTYAPVGTLRRLYDEALAHPQVMGLSIGTRPDCLGDDVLDLIESYARRLHVWLEIGLQSAHDATLKRINRGHDWACFENAMRRASGRGIFLCVHIIHGLPGETDDMMRETVRRVAALSPDGIKIHHLHLIEGTPMTESWKREPFPLLDLERYVSLVADSLEPVSYTHL
ncbi:MAG: TIGR01212 family radical SAM protein, partial [Planctomycetota bacterium]|nr:TIGR01212 family radical SAM protein [Planctomycetota bacterium]